MNGREDGIDIILPSKKGIIVGNVLISIILFGGVLLDYIFVTL